MNIYRAQPITEEQLIRLRAASVASDGEPPVGGFTCDACGARYKCTLVFDWYNTAGDCLAEK